MTLMVKAFLPPKGKESIDQRAKRSKVSMEELQQSTAQVR